MHGFALVVHRLWSKLGIKINKFIAWFITFNFVNIAWIFFRATNFNEAINILKAMFGLNGIVLPHYLIKYIGFLQHYEVQFEINWSYYVKIGNTNTVILFTYLLICIAYKNSVNMLSRFNLNYKTLIFSCLLLSISFLSLNHVSEFLYFNF